MKDKYYTPEIEEFHVGFEFECSNDKLNYKKQIYYGSQVLKSKSYYDDHGCEYDAVEDDLKHIRVKYLDKEDIESLGFKPQYPDMKNTGFINKNIYESGATIIGLRGDSQVSITKCHHPNTSTLVFTIKNKSELKRLLKQLNI